MHKDTTFSLEARVTACHECGAPLVVQAAGGRLPCNFCGTTQQIGASSRAVPRAPAEPEAQRLARLRSQDGSPVAVAQDLVGLMPAGEILPWKAAEAMGLWKAGRTAATSSGAAAAGERLCWLTLGLADHYEKSGNLLGARALLEGALDALSAPRHRQLVCAALSRCACRVADLPAANAWLALCDPTAPELEADSAYRYAHAYLNTAEKRFDAVLAVLGRSPAEVPIASLYDPECAVLRAHAWERSGQTATAVALLAHFKQLAGGLLRLQAARFIERHRSWGVCATSHPESEARQRALGVHAAAEAAGKPLLLGVITLACFGAGLAVTLGLAAFGLVVVDALGLCGFIGMPFAVLAADNFRKAAQAKRLRREGMLAMGQVVDGTPTGTVTMGVPEIEYKLLVFTPSARVQTARATLHATPEQQARYVPGCLVAVRFAPQDPEVAQIEID